MHALLQRIIQKLDSGEWRIVGDETVPDWLRALVAGRYSLRCVKLVAYVHPVCEQRWDGAYVRPGTWDDGTSTLHVVWQDGDVVHDAHVDIDRRGQKEVVV